MLHVQKKKKVPRPNSPVMTTVETVLNTNPKRFVSSDRDELAAEDVT